MFNSPSYQLSGFGVRAWELTNDHVLYPKFWWPAPGTQGVANDIFLTFRDNLCTSVSSSAPLGNKLTVAGVFDIPLMRNDAVAKGFVQGNCINK